MHHRSALSEMAFNPHRCCFLLAFGGLLLSTAGIMLQEPLLAMSLNGPDETSIPIPVFAYIFFINPLTFYLNTLWLLLNVITHAAGSEAPLSVFLMKHLPGAAHTVSFVTLFFVMPLSFQVAITEESIGLAIGAVTACLVLVTILSSFFKILLICCGQTSRGFVPAESLALCVSSAFLNLFDPILSLSNTNRYEPFLDIALHYLLLFVSSVIFMLGITLLILCISAPTERQQDAIQAEHLAIVALSVAFATLLIGVYMKVFAAATGMSAVGGDVAK